MHVLRIKLGKTASRSHHLADKGVDEFFSVTPSTVTFTESVSLLFKATEWGRELHWPEEVVGFLEVWATSDDFVDQIFNAVDTNLTKGIGNDLVISEWNSSSINLTVTSLVDQF